MRHRKSFQQGSVLVVAVFVIVVMGFLATSLVQVQWSNHDTLTRKQLGTQAWLLSPTTITTPSPKLLEYAVLG